MHTLADSSAKPDTRILVVDAQIGLETPVYWSDGSGRIPSQLNELLGVLD
jgi:hypothetical protein